MSSFAYTVCECDQVLLLLLVNELNYSFNNAGSFRKQEQQPLQVILCLQVQAWYKF